MIVERQMRGGLIRPEVQGTVFNLAGERSVYDWSWCLGFGNESVGIGKVLLGGSVFSVSLNDYDDQGADHLQF